MSSASDKAKLVTENVFENSDLNNSGISLPSSSSSIKLEQHNIPLNENVRNF